MIYMQGNFEKCIPSKILFSMNIVKEITAYYTSVFFRITVKYFNNSFLKIAIVLLQDGQKIILTLIL